ncbi:molybdopterin-dependent oxidoreductase [Microbacterium atlanticum]|uniref:molybdopterin-dependent oxidoreductase n=1 Tax=Microbacterium atlanticum TaxID=2782168 RepID=UPI0018873874|nr:molybdopterin-dependent oxidoreductase [Microbacterium atlanticum]
MAGQEWASQLAHWGAYEATTDGADILAVRGDRRDPEPTDILQNLPGMVTDPARVTRPAIREGWLRDGPGGSAGRGDEPFVDVDWDTALDLVAREIRRVQTERGPSAIYGGSYGWASAGRFHHALSQVHRFLNCTGGYTRSVNTYSFGASEVILPHVIGPMMELYRTMTSWDVVVEHTRLMVAFGGVSPKNSAVSSGGVLRHRSNAGLREAIDAGMRLVSLTPLRSDSELGEWMPLRPGSDVALMLALSHVLLTEGLADAGFLREYAVGAEVFHDYVVRGRDGGPFDPEWAQALTGVPAEAIRALARDMAATRTMISVSWSLQRARFGEQPIWAAVALAALLGQIGLPGGGFAHGYGTSAAAGVPWMTTKWPSFPQGRNPSDSFIPVARIADMLLHPGESYRYNGETRVYPEISLMYWAGGNPFHHHQDLPRLRRAIGTLDTFVVNESHWTATARHADIVLPTTTHVERNDLGAANNDEVMIAMKRLVPPHGEAWDDYDVFAALSRRLGVAQEFTEGLTVDGWLRRLYDEWAEQLAPTHPDLPSFDHFWSAGEVVMPHPDPTVQFAQFRADPDRHRLSTPSGRIEIFSATVDAFGEPDCPGHPSWLGFPDGDDARFPLTLLANQPRTRLHSQLDMGRTSKGSKIAGREPLTMHPDDARERGIAAGDVVEVVSTQGTAVVGVRITDQMLRGVVQLSTGAWYAPSPGDDRVCLHGNPNVLTPDIPTSALAQGPTGAVLSVEVRPRSRDWPRPDVHRRPSSPDHAR